MMPSVSRDRMIRTWLPSMLVVAGLFIASAVWAQVRRGLDERQAPPLPAAGTQLKGIKVTPEKVATVDMRQLALQEAARPKYNGPPMPLVMDQFEEQEMETEPGAAAIG